MVAALASLARINLSEGEVIASAAPPIAAMNIAFPKSTAVSPINTGAHLARFDPLVDQATRAHLRDPITFRGDISDEVDEDQSIVEQILHTIDVLAGLPSELVHGQPHDVLVRRHRSVTNHHRVNPAGGVCQRALRQ
jgi:hypothetical protein